MPNKLSMRLRSASREPLFRASAIMFAGFIVSSACNYGYQVLMGRLLAPAHYGTLNALMSAAVVFSVPVAALQMAISRLSSIDHARGEIGHVIARYRSWTFKTVVFGAAAFVVWMLCLPLLRAAFKNAEAASIVAVGCLVIVSFIVPLASGAIQGLHDFRAFGILQGLAGPLKLIFGVGAVLLGLGVTGALSGVAVGQLALLAVALYFLWPQLRNHSAKYYETKQPLAGFVAMTVGTFGFTLLTQADMYLASRILSADEAGYYAAAAVLGKAVMYLPGSIVLAMFPAVAAAQSLEKSSHHLLIKSLAATWALSLPAAIAFAVAPELITKLLFGARYAAAADSLRWFGFAMLPCATLMVLMHYTLALGNAIPGAVLFITGAAFTLITWQWAHSVATILTAIATCASIATLILFWIAWNGKTVDADAGLIVPNV
jgi:O-antigen/teichoic acid export membrane protein